MNEPASLVVRRIGRLTSWAQPVAVDAAVVVTDGVVAWLGPDRDLPAGLGDRPELDAAGAAVLPGFVDCHTHSVWAGSRRDDLAGRLAGGGYRPAGIASTVAATRAASYDELLAQAVIRLHAMRSDGTTSVEVKSGYGLTAADEARILAIAAEAGAVAGVTVTTTYLGAHVVPEGREHDEYVDEVVAQVPIARAAGARWCDVFCEEGAFSEGDARRILVAARDQGLGTRIHAEQLTRSGGAALAAELGCASADHLDYVTAQDAAALAAAGVVGVLVPVASLYTRNERWSHAAVLRDAGVTMAVATDCNPGTAWCESMPYAIQLACLGLGLSVDEALRAATLGGAAALKDPFGGQLGVGARADLIVLTSDHEADLVAHLGAPAIAQTVIGGTVAAS